METLNTVLTAALVLGVGILLRFSTKGQIEDLKQSLLRLEERLSGRMDRLEARMDRFEARMDRLDTRFDGFAADLNTQLHAVRSDLTQLAISLGVQGEAESGG